MPRLRIRMETNSWSLHRAGNYSFTMYSYYVIKYMCSYLCLFNHKMYSSKISYMHLVASIHYIHLRFVASRLFYFLLLDRNSMYIIILNLLYTHSNRHVVALGGHHFDNNCSKRLMPMSKPCASTTKSSNINVTLVRW